MLIGGYRLVAAVAALGVLTASAAHADRRHHEGWHEGWREGHGGWHERHDHGDGDAIAGAIIGLGAAALIGGIIASQSQYSAPPPVVYAPPPAYYPPPANPEPSGNWH